MKIWVDADACPRVVREILFRAAGRTGAELILVANQRIEVPKAANVRMLVVSAGFDVADNEIVRRIEAGDLLITSDLPLAAEALAKGARVLTSRGEELTRENIGPRLNMRDFLESMRASGMQSGGPPPYDQRDRKAFADALDRMLATLGRDSARPSSGS